jgi:carbon monoxide dehydrogenase subunit G
VEKQSTKRQLSRRQAEMQLLNEFSIPIGIEESWAVLTDVRRIAPCLPGAYLTEVDGDTFHGVVRVKVGPITASYRGTAQFVAMDPGAHRAVLRADAREERGSGNAHADIELRLRRSPAGTVVAVETQLAISGRVAQFGRGVIGDISSRLIAQFATGLEQEIRSPLRADAVPGADTPRKQPRVQAQPRPPAVEEDRRPADVAALPWPDAEPDPGSGPMPAATAFEPEPLNLMASVVVPYLRRLALPVAVAAPTAVVCYLAGRRRGAASGATCSRYGTMVR